MAIGRVLVCDDSDGSRAEFVASINQAMGIEVAENHTGKDLKEAIAALIRGETGGTLFDGADVAVIDNRLIDDWTADDDPKVSAEQLADLVRISSTAGVVVILNQYREIDFDLRLDGRLDSYADLNITDKCLDCANLWKEEPPRGFRPWAWPVLPRLVEQMRRRQDWLLAEGRLDQSVLQALELNSERIVRSLSRAATDFLHPTIAPDAVTFREFVEGATRSTDGKHRGDFAADDRLVAKIAAARIGKWLESTVLGPQDLLVDVPHLLERFSILVNDPGSLDSWNAAVSWSETTGFRSERIRAFEWGLWRDWLGRPAYLWPLLQEDDALATEQFAPDAVVPAEAGFCEDVSRFLPIDETSEFVANFDSAFDRRRVRRDRQGKFVYGPASRLAR
ncbi:hypothetical protein ACXIUS_04390 [Bosea thiooxidans]|jgi:hypothetical protein|uniref:Uncharacterized protein n=1 Tax=Bosea thiooxidans TaxID=53254 RepID=A0A0Q3I618_9HYPH|nr:hypothetical protein [Bosea thiooxidans]KQK30439.1 hypothetical protein ARD30_13515 [Bosea thiooxidans]